MRLRPVPNKETAAAQQSRNKTFSTMLPDEGKDRQPPLVRLVEDEEKGVEELDVGITLAVNTDLDEPGGSLGLLRKLGKDAKADKA